VDDPTGEFASTILDLNMLADLAEYHALKTRAATVLCFSERTGEVREIAEATAYMSQATDAWRSLSERGRGTYHDDLVFGMGPHAADEGNWEDRLVEMEADCDEMEERCEAAGVDPDAISEPEGLVTDLVTAERQPFDFPTMDLDVPASTPAGESV